MSTMRWRCALAACGALMMAIGAPAAPLGTAFTYQGRLIESGAPVTATCDFEFKLYDAPAGGSQVGATYTALSVSVSDGLFTTLIDFGGAVFLGDAHWLEVGVRKPAGSGSYTPLAPRQQLTPTPNALWSTRAGWSSISAILVLPFIGSVSDPNVAFSITNTGTGKAIHAETSGPIAMSALAPGNSLAFLGLGSVLGSQGSGAALAYGVKGEATNAGGVTRGVWGTTASSGPLAEGVRGDALAPLGLTFGVRGTTASTSGLAAGVQGECLAGGPVDNYGIHGAAGGDGVLAAGAFGESLSAAGPANGVYGLISSIGALAAGVFGYSSAPGPGGITFGVIGQNDTDGALNTGVYGVANTPGLPTVNSGVWGYSNAINPADAAAGVRAEGNGVMGPGLPNAAALHIRDGAIYVSGTSRPAGAICVPGPWTAIHSCREGGQCPTGTPPHGHIIGWYCDVVLLEDLIVAGPPCMPPASIIEATAETMMPPPPCTSYYVQVHSKFPGTCTFRVSRMGSVSPCQCAPPAEPVWVNYLIINPAPLGMFTDPGDPPVKVDAPAKAARLSAGPALVGRRNEENPGNE